MKKINSYSFKIMAIAVLFALLFQSCKHNEPGAANDNSKYVLPDSLAKALTYDTIQVCQVTNTITLTGKVAFNDDHVAKIYPMVSGSIQNIKVMLGDYVQKGQVLGVIKSSEMAGLSNDLVSAQSNLRVAKKNLESTQEMFKSGLSSQKDILSAEAA